MSVPKAPDPQSAEPNPVEDMLASPELARAIEDDDFKRFFDSMPIAFAVSRQTGRGHLIVYANAAFEQVAALGAAEAEKRSWNILEGFKGEDRAALTLADAAMRGSDFLGVFRTEASTATVTLVQAYAAAIEKDDGTENYRVLALVDVSAFERADREDYERKIRDKDVMLKELQHRVKNNLQLITALVRLESRSAQRGAPVDLSRLAGRIEALAVLYQTLEADSFGPELDLGPYLSQIATAAIKANAVDGIALETRMGYAPASVNVAMPIGLLVNELLTNAFKYAFDGRAEGTISVEATRDGDDRYRVTVADNGCGFADGASWPMPGKLASLVVQTLRENAGDLTVNASSSPQQGTQVTIEFRHTAPSLRTN